MSNKPKGAGFGDEKIEFLTLKTNHILAIGIDKYKYQTPLENPVDDCKKIIEVLCTQYRFEKKNVKTLFDDEATRDNILETLDEYEGLTEKDNLLILFSGHGHYKKRGDAGFWVPYNAEKQTQYISMADIKQRIKACHAHHISLIVDSCFSGALTRKAKTKGNKIHNNLASIRSYKRKSRWAMTSGRVELVYDGNKGENSPFARGLISELKNNDKEMLLFSELGLAVRHIANRNADQNPSCSFLREVGDMNGEFSFVLKDYVPVEDELEETGDDTRQIAHVPPSIPTKKIEKPKPEPKMDTLKGIKKQLHQWVMEAELKKAYQYLVDHLDEDSSHKSTVYNRMGGWNRLQRNIATGVATNVPQQEAQHRQALGYVIDNMEEEDLKI